MRIKGKKPAKAKTPLLLIVVCLGVLFVLIMVLVSTHLNGSVAGKTDPVSLGY
jgi:hypothetical protein